jgi:hypothetical protein
MTIKIISSHDEDEEEIEDEEDEEEIEDDLGRSNQDIYDDEQWDQEYRELPEFPEP